MRMPGQRIHLLPETLSNQIAAGEVVERPAAVVKELVENAIDAGAKNIEVDLLEGGRRFVRVKDDGSGMGREDALLSLQRHATSKLRSKEDLFAISSYGFRGEALPSIAAVSRFVLLTAEPGALAGTRVCVDGGELLSAEDAGAPAGTTIEVRDLFWNVPVRRKFLKRPPTEQSYAVEAVTRLALPRRDIGFTVREGERTLFRSPAGATLAARAELALGREVRDALLPFEASVRGLRAFGLAASPAVSASSGRGIWLFVNGRAIRDRQLMHAVLQAYGEVLPHGRYPSALVFLEVHPSEVDVNVHPAKAEVRLADGRAGYEAIRNGIAEVLVRGSYLSDSRSAGEESAGAAEKAAPVQHGEAVAHALRPLAEALPARVAEALARYGSRHLDGQEPHQGGHRHEQHVLVAPAPYFAGLRYLGQLHRTYLVCEGPRGLVLIDQHAAHERMNYQRLRASAAARQTRAQPLLLPIVVSLPAGQVALLGEAGDELARLGFELAEMGGGAVAVQALPASLAGLGQGAVRVLLADLAEEVSQQGRGESLEKLRDALLARAACHASVRAHDQLAPEEAQALLAELDATDYGARCAHGRPVVSEWSLAEVEKRFGRDYESHAHAAPPEAL